MSFGMFARCVALLLLATEVSAGGKSIFQLGTLIDQKPWTVMIMYFAVFLITISLELTVHFVHHTVVSDSGKSIAHHVTQEVMILGGIAAVLVVFENLGGAALIDTALFHYVHFVIFVMAILFITMVSCLFAVVERSWQKWSRFENALDEIEFDPSLDQETRCAFMDKYVNQTPSMAKMASAIVFFKANLPERLRGVSFSRYMRKMQRKFMLEFLDLHVSSWALLGCLMLLAAIVTGITNEISTNTLVTIGLWVLIIGYGSMLCLVVVFFKIRREFTDFASEVQYRSTGKGKVRPQADHFWRNPHFMTKIMQTMLLYQVFFLATVITNHAYRLIQSDQTGDLGWPLVFVCVLPSLFVFLVMIPLILPPFTVLASMGEYLDHDAIICLMAKDKASGRFRRHWTRNGEVLAPPKYLGKKMGVLVAQKCEAVPPNEKRDIDIQCAECNRNAATVRCPMCGFLCAECDVDYHRLRMQVHHTRGPVCGKEDEPILLKKKKETAHTLLVERLKTLEKESKRKALAQAVAEGAGGGEEEMVELTPQTLEASIELDRKNKGRRKARGKHSNPSEGSSAKLSKSSTGDDGGGGGADADYQPLLPGRAKSGRGRR